MRGYVSRQSIPLLSTLLFNNINAELFSITIPFWFVSCMVECLPVDTGIDEQAMSDPGSEKAPKWNAFSFVSLPWFGRVARSPVQQPYQHKTLVRPCPICQSFNASLSIWMSAELCVHCEWVQGRKQTFVKEAPCADTIAASHDRPKYTRQAEI